MRSEITLTPLELEALIERSWIDGHKAGSRYEHQPLQEFAPMPVQPVRQQAQYYAATVTNAAVRS